MLQLMADIKPVRPTCSMKLADKLQTTGGNERERETERQTDILAVLQPNRSRWYRRSCVTEERQKVKCMNYEVRGVITSKRRSKRSNQECGSGSLGCRDEKYE